MADVSSGWPICENIVRFFQSYRSHALIELNSFISQDNGAGVRISLTRNNLLEILEGYGVPPSFIEILANNNGVETAFVEQCAEDSDAGILHISFRLPVTPSVNGCVYYQYRVRDGSMLCLIFGNNLDAIKLRFMEIFSHSGRGGSSSRDPFLILASLIAIYSASIERYRGEMDAVVRRQEARTGVTAHRGDFTLRAATREYGTLAKDMRVDELFLLFLEKTIEYQIQLTDFLSDQHANLMTLESKYARSEQSRSGVPDLGTKVASSLRTSASFSRNRLTQVRTLSRRIQIQLSLVSIPQLHLGTHMHHMFR
ncbi:MAG: hypothetical protein M1825_001649 [Sarcosagium campestre]|nr:MAG: hypothetical protein M1825_001649 [Sarcosagium campestre]